MPHPHRRTRAIASCATLMVAAGLAGGVAIAPASAAGSVAQVAAATPSAPTSVTAGQAGAGRVTVTWKAPASEGSSPVTGYDVGFSAGEWGNGRTVAATDRSTAFVDLAKGSYSFSVAAVNAAGQGKRVTVPVTVSTGAPAPTVAVSATTLTAGGRLTISGRGTPDSELGLERALPGRAYVPIGSIVVDGTGSYTDTRTVRNTATYRVRGASGATRAGIKVVVRNRMDIAATRTAVRTYRLSGTVFPAHDGQQVSLGTRRADGSYASLASVRTDATGHWSYKRTYAAATYTFRARSAATTLNAPKAITLTVAVQ